MVCLQQPSNLVPHVVEGGVCHSASRDNLIAVQPRIVLQQASMQSFKACQEHADLLSETSGTLIAKMMVTGAVRAEKFSSLLNNAAPHAGHKACMHSGWPICSLTILRRVLRRILSAWHHLTGKGDGERACLLTMDMKL